MTTTRRVVVTKTYLTNLKLRRRTARLLQARGGGVSCLQACLSRRRRAGDKAAAQHAHIVGDVIQHTGLTRRHAFFRRAELDIDAVDPGDQPRRHRRPRRTHPRQHLCAGQGRVVEAAVAQPVGFLQPQPPRQQRLARADQDFARFGIELDDEQGLADGDVQPAPLADGITGIALVRTECAAADMADGAGLRGQLVA